MKIRTMEEGRKAKTIWNRVCIVNALNTLPRAETPENKERHFILFNKLATEIRVRIWRYFFPSRL
jgi:hypothetical protein